jgi:hypothetical protein
MATQASSTLATHRSYRATKSPLVTTAEVGVGGGNSEVLKLAPSQTMLAQEGATQESWGLAGSVGNCCWIPSSLASLPSTPIEGDAGRQESDVPALTQPADTCNVPLERGRQ